jgi:uncharacterized protein (DUF1015 family)
MVEIFPFKGIIYNKEKIKKLDDVMSPPYDIISEEDQKKLYNKHPKNYVRLILNKKEKTDNVNNNRYTRAKKLYEEWLSDSTLIESDKDTVFAYKIHYKIDGSKKTMNGFFVLLKIDSNYKFVKAHERTLSKPKEDRLNLLRICRSNLEPIQLLYIDEKDKIKKAIDNKIKKPIIDVKDHDGFNHKLWKLEDNETISMIQNELKNKVVFIADGHHRYQTSINYANEMNEKTYYKKTNNPFNFIMVVLANIFDEGLSILPTHRFVKKRDIKIQDCLDNLKNYFIIEEKIFIKKDVKAISKKIIEEIKTKNKHIFALYTKDKYFILTLKDEKIMDELASDRSTTWRTLDVSILHKIVFEHAMGITQDNLEDHVKYTRIDEEAIKYVNQGKYDFSVLMNATKINELKKIAESGEHMPQKSTYFLPKMLSGLVAYKME